MKIVKGSLLISILFLVISCNLPKRVVESVEKYDRIITKNTEVRQIISKEVKDTFYVYIKLPKNYYESNKNYPVLYLLDGDISFNMASSVVRYLQYGKNVPEIIIVAPGYGTMMSDNEQNFRERDYTISKIDRFENSGNAMSYLNFLKKELIPQIDSNYRTDDKRILNGYSLGGLFALNTLLNSPQTFNYIIAGSPYLSNDLEFLIEQTKIKSDVFDGKKVFISVGELENKKQYHIPINKMVDGLKNITGLQIKFVEFKNGTHFTCPAEALSYGLKFVFEEG